MKLEQYHPEFDKVIEHIKVDIGTLRTNRATPSMLENLMVEVYGSKMPLNQLGSIQAPEPRMLTVEPWDKSVLKNIEKAIQTASLGLNVSSEGTFLRIALSPMTEETRKELIKVLNDKLESGRRSLRGVRDDVKEAILAAEKNKEITEDERYKLVEGLDKLVREYNDKVEELGKKKEEEIKL
ncbi:ribosome recycling factor [Candidatus Kuenenbacteria bacterium]|nr:ribosome recycling factor [Candidatus Kuenenbacteria bacterium]